MENKVTKDVDDKIKKTTKKLTSIIEEVEDLIPEIAEEVAPELPFLLLYLHDFCTIFFHDGRLQVFPSFLHFPALVLRKPSMQ